MTTSGRMIGANASVARALRYSTWARGKCLNFVAQMATGGRSLGVSAPSAYHAWQHARLRYRTGTPPKGAFVFWSTSRHPYGHIALSVGGGKVRHDWGGRVVTTSISYVNGRGYKYLGWSKDLYGQRNL